MFMSGMDSILVNHIRLIMKREEICGKHGRHETPDPELKLMAEKLHEECKWHNINVFLIGVLCGTSMIALLQLIARII